MSSDRGSTGSAGVQVGTDWYVTCYVYPDRLPILCVDAGTSSLTITLAARSVPGEHGVKFAQELARQAERFKAECERLHAAQSAAELGTAASDEAAGNAAA